MSKPENDSLSRRILAVAFAALLIASASPVGTAIASAGAPADAVAASASVQETGNETADHVYRYENGSAVLVYESEAAGDDVSTARFGADVSEALVDAVVVSSTDSGTELTGQFGMVVRPGSIRGDGNLTMPTPENLDHLNATVTGTFTPNESAAEASVDARFGEALSGVSSLDTTGEAVVGPNSFGLDTRFSIESPLYGSRQGSARNVTVVETDGGYRVDFDVERPINRFVQSRWNTSEAARATVRETYRGLASQYGGTVEVTFHSYNYTEAPANSSESDRLDAEYTVSLTGVEEGVAEQVAGQVASSESLDVSAQERDALAESIQNVTVERIGLEYTQNESGMTGSATVSVANYQDPFLSYLEGVASGQEAVNQTQVAELRERLAVRDDAGLRQVLAWNASISSAEAGGTTVDAGVTYDTVNWQAYTSELAERGMPVTSDVTFEGYARTQNGQIAMNATFQVDRDRIVDSILSQAAEAANGTADGSGESAVEAIRAMEDAQLQVARADLIFGREEIEVRAAAKFENLSEFQGVVDRFPSDVPVTHVYSDASGNATKTYVYVEGLNMTTAELRESSLADDETTVHAPGEWNRTFPTMDIATAGEYLGVDADVTKPPHSGDVAATPTTTATSVPSTPTDAPEQTESTTGPTDATAATTTSGDGTGFGLGVGFAAVFAGAFVALRRRD